jgi:uncharacterized integral membrane protein
VDSGAKLGTPDGQASSEGTADDSRARSLRPTRISWVWVSVLIGLVLGIALLDFVLQNTRSVRIEFFSASGRIPIAVALLGAALAGAAVVAAVGIARIVQLRRRVRAGSGTVSATAAQARGDARGPAT